MSIPTPWGAYIAGNANNTSTRLFDLTGNGRHATISGTGYSTGTSSGNGAAASIPYIGGTTATKITWPAGSIPTTFTICSITRVTTSSEKTLLMGYGVGVGTDIYFVHGHWFTPARCSGVAYYGNGWRTQPSSAATSAASYQNWLVMCGSNGTNATPNNILANGVGVGTANGGTSADGTLRINGTPGYESNFQFQQLYIWNVALTNAQLATVSSDMMNYLSTGVITGSYTQTPIISGFPNSSNILYNDNKLYFFSSSGTTGCNVYNTSGTLITSAFITGYGISAFAVQQFYNNSFYVPDYSISKVFKYSSTGVVDNTYTLSVANPLATIIANNIFYVSSYPGPTVKTFNILTGAAINASLLTISGNVSALAISGTTLYVASENGNISLYNATTGAAINTNFITGANITYAMVLDSKYLYVAHFTVGDAKVYNATTGALVATLLSRVESIRGITLDSSFVYVTTQTSSSLVYKVANPYYTPPSSIGTAPTITSITTSTSSFSVFFTAGTGGTPAPTTYQYSLNGGSTYTNANTTTSPIVISSGVSQGVTYQIALIATNAAGNTAASNIVAATIPKIGTAPTITSITVGTSSFSVFFTAGTGGTPAPTTYQYSLNGGSTYTNANTTTSPIVISIGISPEFAYQVTLIATNAAGNTAASNMVVANIAAPCFLEGSKILRLNLETDQEEYVAVETLREGDLIKTSRNGYKAVFHIGRKTLPNPANDPDKRNRLYRFPKSMSKNMIADLCITGEHCVLYKDLSPILKSRVHKHMGDIYITEYQYRVPACLDERATAYTGTKAVTIWHFALESDNIYYNYGVYANGLLVESCSIQYLTELSNMELV